MIIGIDASRANRDHKSGTEWYSYYVIKELAALDDSNEYILYTDKPLKDGLLNLGERAADCHNSNFKIDATGHQELTSPHGNFRGKVLKWPFKFFWTQGRLSLEMLAKPPDVLFVPAHALPLIHPKKSVVTIHDIGFKQEEQLYSRELIGYQSRWLNLLIRLFTRGKYRASGLDYLDWSTGFALRHSQKIITISNFSKEELLKFYRAEAAKIKVVYNGYPDWLFKPLTDSQKINRVLAKYGIERPFIFYVGRLDKKKNIARLVEAYVLAKHQRNFPHKLYLIGDASFGYDEVKYLINEFNAEGEVVPTGWIDEADLPAIFSGGEVFVLPSKYEGFGLPLLQAMACGKPIVASRAASIPEITADAAILFDPDDVYDMADKLGQVVTDKELRQKLIARGLDRVKDFSWHRSAEATLKVLTDW